MKAVLCVCLLGAASVACSKPWPVDTPPPPVRPAPDVFAQVGVYVHQHVHPAENAQDKWDYENMPGYTGGLRQAFITQLQAAHYTVVVQRSMPYDLHALVQAEWPLDAPGTASLVLTSTAGQHVATFSASIPLLGEPPRIEYLEGDAAVTLVDAMTASPEVFAFAHRVLADRASSGTVIAE